MSEQREWIRSIYPAGRKWHLLAARRPYKLTFRNGVTVEKVMLETPCAPDGLYSEGHAEVMRSDVAPAGTCRECAGALRGCSRCGELLPRHRKDSYCAACRRAYRHDTPGIYANQLVSNRRWNRRHPERLREYRARYEAKRKAALGG